MTGNEPESENPHGEDSPSGGSSEKRQEQRHRRRLLQDTALAEGVSAVEMDEVERGRE
jgi:hypothetical protein